MDKDNPETKRFGRYEIAGELGRGAMGIVYKARDPQIGRMVALKTVSLRSQEAEEEKEFRSRFLNESRAAGRLHHPGIVAVFDVGEDPETQSPYIVLEYVAGEALNRLLAREKKLPLDKALQFAEEIATALDYAHAQGVIHRDIKPGNILITHDGHAKIADFGIAKLNLAHFTLPGKVLGTPAYMAPEQLSGEGVDKRSDLFSLGVILYAMVTGHSPFQGDSATTVCFKVANREPVPVSALDLNLPRKLDAIIARAMAKDRKQRYQRGEEFASDLRQLRAQYQPGSTTTSLQAIAGTGSQKDRQAATLSRRPAVGLAYAVKLVRAAILKAPAKDLILGVATVIMLLIVGVQSKLLSIEHDAATDVAETAKTRADQIQANAGTSGSAVRNAGTPATKSVAATAANGLPAHSATKATVRRASARRPSGAPVSSDLHPVSEVVVPFSTVELAVRHQFQDATLSVWVDDKLASTRPLHGGAEKRLGLFNGVRGIESQTLKVPAGKHVLRFRAQSQDQTIDLSRTISAQLIGGNDKTLQITFDKHNTAMHLKWQ